MATKSNTENGYTDLGKMPDMPTDMPSISVGMDDSGDDDSEGPKPYYPSFCICTDKPLSLGKAGDSGECSIKYTVEESAERERDGEPKEYRYELKVQGIKPTGKPVASADTEQPKSSKGFQDALMNDSED